MKAVLRQINSDHANLVHGRPFPLLGLNTTANMAHRDAVGRGVHSIAYGAGIDGLVPEGGVWTGLLDALLDAWTDAAGYRQIFSFFRNMVRSDFGWSDVGVSLS